ncbi:MAG TPA: FecR family protein [Ignavibacteriaceae bacterium]|jgi:hypothetical protein|nr:FecR family protein [Ignavibacteriaceae bacterium]
MKKLIFTMVILLFSVSLLFSGNNPKSKNPVALITKIVQDVKVKTDENDWTNAKPAQLLESGNEIKTGKKSLALIKFTDNSLLRVVENTSLKIYADKKTATKDISKNTHIDKGELGFEVKKQQDEEFKFTTPTMVASIRGTSGTVEVYDDGTSLLSVETGEVEVNATLGDKQSGNVTAGKYATVNLDGQLDIKESTPEIQKKQEKTRRSETKKLMIKTNKGFIVIEYYE